MIEFFKTLLSKINFHSDNKTVNQLNKIIYSVILLCAVIFIGFILYFIIQKWPDFLEALKYNWNETKSMLHGK